MPNDKGVNMRSELQRIGYLGNTPCTYRRTPMSAHFELHIEQAPLLEAEKRRIGVVRGVQGYRWYEISVFGQENHTGATSFRYRADPLLAASKMILASHRIAFRYNALASSGILKLAPGSVNTVPGVVRFSLDIRAPLDETVETVEHECKQAFAAIARGDEVREVGSGSCPSVQFESAATHFDEDCIDCIKEAGQQICAPDSVAPDSNSDLLGDWGKYMTSGAGHDSVHTSKRCPTAMIFVPCRDGISHNPREYSSPEACDDGTNVLFGAILRFDDLLRKASC
ncbi:hypothetical protein D0865_00545 [Hortaea werneckii]|uniref:Peptidase M20 dimerisation domain-containing protein n=1 Tax=Hortaea werneckii TaxID=91943 RepID=A0A3M7DD58_HORWE|nr:hypothetical protein D0865_00545 [Hortaea werneckii]